MSEAAAQGANDTAQVAGITQAASREALGTSRELIGFGPHGAAQYQKHVEEYLIILEKTSRAVAEQRGVEVVGPAEVTQAANSLGIAGSRKAKHAGEIGALLIGAGLAYLGSVLVEHKTTFSNAVISFVPILIGVVLTVFSWTRD
jgi:hypothetical protein